MPRAPLSEHDKQVLRDRLAAARAAKAAKTKLTKLTPQPAATPVSTALSTDYDLLIWNENDWLIRPMDYCQTRLATLRKEFETGCRMVGQRRDLNQQSSFRCMVCGKPSMKWVRKIDYLNTKTGLYESLVIDSQNCDLIFANSKELQDTVRALTRGSNISVPEPLPPDDTEAA